MCIYTCTYIYICDVFAKISEDHLLLVGCGIRKLWHWTPTARAFDGLLELEGCKFDLIDAPASAICKHAGKAMLRQRPFDNYSSLIPYCPPG